MEKWVKILNTGELKQGEMKSIDVSGKEILVARVGDNYYAADNRCPHLGGKLSSGNLNGPVVTCPLHGSQFDLTNGDIIKWTNWSGVISKLGNAIKSPRKLNIYPVKVEQDKVKVELP
jgi:3-phenylpropionate/trans-cinnamate dioxygenase ferredoxin component